MKIGENWSAEVILFGDIFDIRVSEKWKQQKYLMEKAFATCNTLFMKLTALRNTREKKLEYE